MKTIYTFFCSTLFSLFALLSFGQINEFDTPTTINERLHVAGVGSKLVVGDLGGTLSKLTVNAEPGTEIARFRSNGITKVFISNVGDVGIGTASPTAKLDVIGNTELNGALKLVDGNQAIGKVLTSDAAGIATWQTPVADADWTISGANLYRAAGDVGIGTSSPSAALHIKQVGTAIGDGIRFQSATSSEDWYMFMDINDDFNFRNDASNFMKIEKNTGNVAIGTVIAAGHRLSVDGKIACEEVLVELSGSWPDYVFKSDYDLKSLDEVKKHITLKGHLPGVPSAQEVENNGIQVGEMNKILMEKVEELTLYILQQEDNLNTQKEMIEAQAKRLDALESFK